MGGGGRNQVREWGAEGGGGGREEGGGGAVVMSSLPGEEFQAKCWRNVESRGSHEIESITSDVQEVQALPSIL